MRDWNEEKHGKSCKGMEGGGASDGTEMISRTIWEWTGRPGGDILNGGLSAGSSPDHL